MADNIAITPGVGKTIAADDISGVLYQRIKPAFGVDGAAVDVSASNPLPVTIADASVTIDGALTDTELRATPVNVAISDASVTVDGPLTNAELRASAVAVAQARVALTTVTGTTATSGDNTLVAAPGAGNKIYIYKVQIQLEAATATTILIKSGSTTVDRVYCASAGDGKLEVYPTGRELPLGTNEALILNLSGANAIGYTIRYAVEAA